ncbi:tripartite tricarboxylate transporter substrate binding protein [Achromobacter animicus]|uniref:Bug family tripartite tricarboxylate transporter substrate binding protein n=1 Tax=Achromobacter animicus TaxID=1389935 RepID=UPI0028AB2F56|nr:tripartite tricarboxylate transporter substrate binding protein [Achromobacter animicus]
MARIIAEQLGARVNETVIVESKPGASGLIASNYVRGQAPDGKVLYLSSAFLAVAPAVEPNIHKFNPATEFTPIARLALNTSLFIVNNNLPVKTFPEFLAYAKENPGKVRIGTGGQGTTGHLAAAYLAKATGIEFIVVHYKGSAPANQDLMGGFIDAKFDNLASTRSVLDSGKVKILGVSSKDRSPLYPDMPALNEFVPGLEVDDFFVIVAPKGMSKDQADALSTSLREIVSLPDVEKKLRDQLGAVGAPLDSTTTGAFIQQVYDRTRKWTVDLNIAA